jgi:hypothetical protein
VIHVFHASTQLADADAYGDGMCEAVECAGSRSVQTSLRIGAAAPVFFDRLTVARKVRIVILRIYAGRIAALAASLTPAALDGVADLKLILAEGGTTWQAVFVGCKWAAATTRLVGVSVEWTYEVELAGAPTITITP